MAMTICPKCGKPMAAGGICKNCGYDGSNNGKGGGKPPMKKGTPPPAKKGSGKKAPPFTKKTGY